MAPSIIPHSYSHGGTGNPPHSSRGMVSCQIACTQASRRSGSIRITQIRTLETSDAPPRTLRLCIL
jgi:hypothetical protein